MNERIVGLLTLTVLASWSYGQAVMKTQPFSLDSVHLVSGPLYNLQQACDRDLGSMNQDRLLNHVRADAGLKSLADAYPELDENGRTLPAIGAYLRGLSQSYATTKSRETKSRIDDTLSKLQECLASRPSGVLVADEGADQAWTDIFAGNIDQIENRLNGQTAPWLGVQRLLSGLLAAYQYEGNASALQIATKLTDSFVDGTRRLGEDAWQTMRKTDCGSMGETLADLASLSRQRKYLDFAQKFVEPDAITPCVAGRDVLAGRRATWLIPQINGVAREYDRTNDPNSARGAKFFWYTVVKHHAYATGGTAMNDMWGLPDQLQDRLSSQTCAVTDTFEFLRLTKHLFQWDPRAEFFDYYERSLYNAILPCFDSETHRGSSYLGLYSGLSIHTDQPLSSIDLAPEYLSRLQDGIYSHHLNQRLYVNLFVPSDVSWLGQKLVQATDFPMAEKATLTIQSGLKQTYELAIRHPAWAKAPVQIRVNGILVATSTKPSTYIVVKRLWKTGDQIEWNLPMSGGVLPLPGNPNRVAFTFGPIVLVGDRGKSSAPRPRSDYFVSNGGSDALEVVRDPGGGAGEFRVADRSYSFMPFYRIQDHRYQVYYDVLSSQDAMTLEKEFEASEARRKSLEARTTDLLLVGDLVSEQNHGLKEIGTETDKVNDRAYRSVLKEGFFDFDSRVDKTAPMQLVVTYWGDERRASDFTILADGNTIAGERLAGYPVNRFYDVTYNLKEETTQGKDKIRIQILASPLKFGPSVAAVRLVRIGT